VRHGTGLRGDTERQAFAVARGEAPAFSRYTFTLHAKYNRHSGNRQGVEARIYGHWRDIERARKGVLPCLVDQSPCLLCRTPSRRASRVPQCDHTAPTSSWLTETGFSPLQAAGFQPRRLNVWGFSQKSRGNTGLSPLCENGCQDTLHLANQIVFAGSVVNRSHG
jgi:hypothetical protein